MKDKNLKAKAHAPHPERVEMLREELGPNVTN